jgi:prepilin-type N-terminal cleavage/methylation domain-containing protein
MTQAASSRGRRSSGGFTLVELLVVIGIIGLLVSILVPALGKARQAANETKCQSNLRQLVTGWLMFANDNKGHLPGNWFDHGHPNPNYRDWLFGASSSPQDAPQLGTIFRYVNNQPSLYRCPTRPDSQIGIRGAYYSNGRFDYPSFLVFSGALISKVRPEATFRYPTMQRLATVPTPMIVEEDNRFVNSSNIDGGHSNIDPMSAHHRGGAYYAAIDGSVHYFKEKTKPNNPADQPTAWNWFIKAPSGREISLGEYAGVTWGWLNSK